jgi:hypothetical protein
MIETATDPLTGKALLQKLKELAHLPKRETTKHCGYYSTTKNERVEQRKSYYSSIAALSSSCETST